MASKFGGAPAQAEGSRSQRAPCAYAAPEKSQHTDRNSQSNRDQSNPVAHSPRSQSAGRGVGGVLGTPPTYAPAGLGSPPGQTRWNDVEPRAPSLDRAPVKGDRRTTGIRGANYCDRMPHGDSERYSAINICWSGLTVVRYPREGRKSKPWGGTVECLRVRASATVRRLNSVSDAYSGSCNRRARCRALREEGRSFLGGDGPTSRSAGRARNSGHPNTTDAARCGNGPKPHRSRRGLAVFGASAAGECAAGVGHQAAFALTPFRSASISFSSVRSGWALTISGQYWRGMALRVFQTLTVPTRTPMEWANGARPLTARIASMVNISHDYHP